MSSQFASAVYPVSRRFIGLAKETTFGTAVAPTFTFPMTTFQPVDKITYLEDTAWRNAMAGLYNLIQGPKIADLSMGGPFFGDGIGYALLNILGDYWQSAPNGTAGTATTVSSNYTAGGATISVTSGTALTTNTVFSVGTGTNLEVRTVASGGGTTTITPNTPFYQNHASGQTVTPYTGVTTYVHNFSLLNSGTGAGGTSNAQPATYTFTDYTGVPASSGARQYAATCLSEMSITGNSSNLVEWDGKATALASAIAGSAPTSSTSSVAPQASWRSTISLGGTSEYNNIEYKLTLTRKVDPKFPNSGQQDPFAIARGELTAAIAMNFDPAVDESELLFFLNNTQPALVLTAGNGLMGANLVSMTINTVPTFNAGQIVDNRTVFGFDISGPMIATTSQVGPSGGYSPLSVTLTNNVVNY